VSKRIHPTLECRELGEQNVDQVAAKLPPSSAESEYDRAIFFFGTDGVLQELAYSKEEIER